MCSKEVGLHSQHLLSILDNQHTVFPWGTSNRAPKHLGGSMWSSTCIETCIKAMNFHCFCYLCHKWPNKKINSFIKCMFWMIGLTRCNKTLIWFSWMQIHIEDIDHHWSHLVMCILSLTNNNVLNRISNSYRKYFKSCRDCVCKLNNVHWALRTFKV